jgi:hypothetical protein
LARDADWFLWIRRFPEPRRSRCERHCASGRRRGLLSPASCGPVAVPGPDPDFPASSPVPGLFPSSRSLASSARRLAPS